MFLLQFSTDSLNNTSNKYPNLLTHYSTGQKPQGSTLKSKKLFKDFEDKQVSKPTFWSLPGPSRYWSLHHHSNLCRNNPLQQIQSIPIEPGTCFVLNHFHSTCSWEIFHHTCRKSIWKMYWYSWNWYIKSKQSYARLFN